MVGGAEIGVDGRNGWEGQKMGGSGSAGWSWSMLSRHLDVPAHSVSPLPQLFMIPEVREGVVQFDQCAELFEDPEDDDEKPLLPAGPSNRKDETGEVRGQYSINHPSTMTPTPPHPTPPYPTPFVVIHSHHTCL